MWPYGGRYFVCAHNATPTGEDGKSAWERRHNRGPFPGKDIHFGARIDFLPPKPILQFMPKFDTRAQPGIFLGWHLHPGGFWSKDYYVALLADFADDSPPKLRGRRQNKKK